MDSDTVTDVPNDNPETYCRLCFSGFYVEPVFPPGAEPRQNVIAMVAKYVDIHITIETDFPCSICRMCQMTLEGFHKFGERCRKLDGVLQRKRLEMAQPPMIKQECTGNASQPAGFDENTVYCLSDTDDDDDDGTHQDDNQLLEEQQFQHEDMEDADEEELIRGDLLIKPDPETYDNEEATVHGLYDEQLADQIEIAKRKIKSRKGQRHIVDDFDIVVLDSDNEPEEPSAKQDDISEKQSRASSTTRPGSVSGKDEPVKQVAEWPYSVTDDGGYQCNICSEVFPLLRDAKQHIRKFHPAESQVYSCNYCEKRFADTSCLRLHIRFHTNDFPHECTDCGQKFMNKSRLDKHFSRYHDKNSPTYTDKRFKCTICPRIFLQATGRDMHIRTFHKIEKTPRSGADSILPSTMVFMCEICNETFDTSDAGKTHLQEKHPDDVDEDWSKLVRRHKCNECSKHFTWRRLLRSHVMTIHNKMPHKCEVCGCFFDQIGKLNKHKARWHTDENNKKRTYERFKCDHCERFFLRNRDRIRHEQTVHDIVTPAPMPKFWEGKRDTFPCYKCDRRFPTMKMVHVHFTIKHPGVPVRFKCNICMKLFRHKTTMVNHIANHTGHLRYPCDQCDDRFIRKKDYDRHLKDVHSEDGPGEDLKRFPCPFCPRKLLTQAARRMHVKHTHAEMEADDQPVQPEEIPGYGPSSLTCTECNKSFTSRSSLKVHCLNHIGKLPHQCEFCSAGFYKPKDLEKHKTRHHSGGSTFGLASRFKCAYCPRIFFRKSARRYHHTVFHGKKVNPKARRVNQDPSFNSSTPIRGKRIKTDPDTDYQCGYCPDIFNEHKLFEEHHAEKHGDEKMIYKCPHCPRRFPLRRLFLSHVKLHIGGYRYPCDECSSKYNTPANLKAHKAKYHSEGASNLKMFKCAVCNRGFLRNQDRVRHQITAHNYKIQGGTKAPVEGGNGAEAPGPSQERKPKMKLLKIKQERIEPSVIMPPEDEESKCSSVGRGFAVESDVEEDITSEQYQQEQDASSEQYIVQQEDDASSEQYIVQQEQELPEEEQQYQQQVEQEDIQQFEQRQEYPLDPVQQEQQPLIEEPLTQEHEENQRQLLPPDLQQEDSMLMLPPPMPTISNVMTIKQEGMGAATRVLDPSEF
ncbi:zinc finger protein 225-like [Uranotaenia lowii]|uniref:zinc finger protein 225-like n=1 Tax=Uranotaenia lowii TaxID=190385 RepID=UPI00247B2A63|nr:zinc finger protein 225-like [Uranotaenia lowii]